MIENHAVFLDGDDTLWKIQEIYDEIKKQFSDLLKRNSIDDEIINKLDNLEMKRVPLRGFTIQRFIESMLIIYAQLSGKYGLQWNIEIEKSIHAFSSQLLEPPKLYDDALPTLKTLSKKTRLFLLSSGDEKVQKQKVIQLNIQDYFNDIFIVPAKSELAFIQIINKIGLKPNRMWMIGNSYRTDILPALKTGMNAILIPRGIWGYDKEINQEEKSNHICVSTLNEATEIIMAWIKNG